MWTCATLYIEEATIPMAVMAYSAVAVGLKVIPVIIEAALGQGFSGLQIIGLPNEYCRDARERIRASLEAVGLSLPARRLVVSVRPIDTLKQFKGGLEHLDLPCAVAIAAALAEQTTPPKTQNFKLAKIKRALCEKECFFAGQLTLTGEVLPLENSLPFEVLMLQKSYSESFFFSRVKNLKTSSHMHHRQSVSHLKACLTHLSSPLNIQNQPAQSHSNEFSELQTTPLSEQSHHQCTQNITQTLMQFAHQPVLGFALYLSAAGRHHLLLSGSPGCGKTFALKAMQNLLPPMTHQEVTEIALIHNRNSSQIVERPYRSPHHSASGAALLGGSLLQPGEVSLAHHGVLFLDELAEFQRPSLEALREPLDVQSISLSRARGRAELPAHFLLLAATNPCPCGYFYSVSHPCRCQASAPFRYQQKLSGPLLERFSILLLIDALTPSASPDVFPDSRILKSFAHEWFNSFLEQPVYWSQKLRTAQAHFWAMNELKASNTTSNSLGHDHALRTRTWSIRKKAQVVHLCETLNFLFNNENTCSLNPQESFEIAAELRGFEQILFESVHLLTPRHHHMQLKKSH